MFSGGLVETMDFKASLEGSGTSHLKGSWKIVRRPIRSNVFKVVAKRYEPKVVRIGKQLGEGSFGIVYQGTVATNDTVQEVVLKRPKPEVEGSAEMAEMERQLNERVRRRASQACAEYLGSCQVEKHETTPNLKQGLWLIWKLEGMETLGHFMRYPHFPRELVEPLLGDSVFKGQTRIVRSQGAAVHLIVAQTCVKQLLDCLATLHQAGMVHRDVKPQNLLLDDETRTFKLIDLGACADMRTGINFNPDETILDPKYAAPEEYVLPLDSAPDLASHTAPVALALGATSWVKHSPDRFDMYAVGIILMQLCLPCLRSDTQLQRFNREFRRFKYDLMRWKRSRRFTKAETRLLDADGGAGWELAGMLLSETPKKRPSASATRNHRWFRVQLSQDLTNPTLTNDEEEDDSPVSEVAGMAMREALARLRRLEAAVLRMEATRTKQTTTLTRLRQEQADPAEISRAEEVLESIDVGLQKRLTVFESVSQDVRRMLGQSNKQIRKAEIASDTQVKRTLENVIEKKASQKQGRWLPPPAASPQEGWGARMKRYAAASLAIGGSAVTVVSETASTVLDEGARRLVVALDRILSDDGDQEMLDEEPEKFVDSLANLWKRVPHASSKAIESMQDAFTPFKSDEEEEQQVRSMRSKMGALEDEVETMNSKMQQMESRLKEQRRLIEIMEREDLDEETLEQVLAATRESREAEEAVNK